VSLLDRLRIADAAERSAAAGAEQRSAGSVELVSTESNDARLLTILGLSGGSVAGVPVTQQSVMSIAAAYACVNNISQDVAGLPCQLFRRTTDGREQVSDHPATWALNLQASPLQNSFHFRQSMTALTLLRGNAYARIEPGARSRAPRLHFKHPDETTVTKSGGRLWYRFSGDPTPRHTARPCWAAGSGTGSAATPSSTLTTR
jgi:phage portal protein BeeE